MKNKGNRKIEAVVFTAVVFLVTAMFLVTVFSTTVNAAPPVNSEKIILNFSFTPPEIATRTINGTVYDQLRIADLPIAGDDGVPLLPVKPVNVLLPQCSELTSIEVTSENISLGYGYNVELGINQSNASSYPPPPHFNTTALYPPELFSEYGTYDFRGYSILTFTLHPVRYINATGKLYYYKSMNVTVTTNATGEISPWFRGLPEDEVRMKEIVDDCSMAGTYQSLPQHNYSSIVDPSESYDYVIITNETLKNSDGDYTFQDLMDYKNSTGTKTTIVTVEDIKNEPKYWWNGTWGDGSPENRFNNTQAQIRNFIKEAYNGWGIKYVLLGGDDEVVPARLLNLTVANLPLNCIPSDLYYACLNGSFNADGDKHWGEISNITDDDHVDFWAEVYIGRACVGNVSELSNFVNKTITYLDTTDNYLEKVLMLGHKMVTPWGRKVYTGYCMDELIDGTSSHGYTTIGIPSNKTSNFNFYYTFDKLYDRDWSNWPVTELIDRINNDVHIINHGGHSNYNYNLHKHFRIDEIDNLTNDKHCFVYSWGCNAGGFDNPKGYDCAAEHFTVKTEHGAFAGIWNTRYGYCAGFRHGENNTDGVSQHYDRQFWHAIFGEGYSSDLIWREIGPANQYSKEKNLFRLFGFTYPPRRILYNRACYYQLTVFGDPQIIIKPAVIPDHDILVGCLDAPLYVDPNATFNISTLIFNQGSNNESNISVNFTVDGNVEDNTVIGSLVKNGRVTLVFNCSLSYGEHQIGIEIQPVPGENVTDNNYWNKTVISDLPPNKPSKPSGPTSGWILLKKYNYSTNTTDPEGNQVYYKWDWGDGAFSPWLGPYDSGENCTAGHRWWKKGDYSIRVKAKDDWGRESNWSDPLPVTMPFSNVMNFSSKSVVVSKSMQFYGNAFGGAEPYNWTWDFGDSSCSYEQNPTHTYSEVGNYTVNLTVTDNESDSSNTTEVVTAVILKADFTDSALGDSTSSELINFNDLSDGVYGIVNWTWDFGDGNISYEQNPSHSYCVDGTYNVTLTVTDNQSNTYVYHQLVYIESHKPEIISASNSPTVVGYGCSTVVSADVIDNQTGNASGINAVMVNITYPDSSYGNYTMDHKADNIYEYVFNDTWQVGQYNYTVWAVDNANNSNLSSEHSFTVSHTFGNTKPGGSNQNVQNRITGSVFTVDEYGVADGVTAYIQSDQNQSGKSKCMIYRKNDSVLIGTTQEIDPATGAEPQWKVYNFSDPKPVLHKNTEYVLVCWSNISCNLAYDYRFPGLSGQYDCKSYGNGTPSAPASWDYYEFRLYSIYCNYSSDETPPEISNVSGVPSTVGFGFNVTITADVTDNISGVNTVQVNITYPDSTTGNFTMNNTEADTYEYVFSDTWLVGQYDYSIWAVDYAGNSNSSSGHSFTVSAQATLSIATLKDSYGSNEYINLTDPPSPPEDYYLVGRGLTWNEYYNASSGRNILEVYTCPVNYQDESSSWTPIECNISLIDNSHPAYGYGYRAGNEHGLYHVYFKPNAQDSWPVAFAYNKSADPATHVVRSKLVGVGYLDPSQDWAYEYLQNVQSSQGQIVGSSATYENVFTGTDVVWTYGNSGLKEEIIMSNTTKTLLQDHPPSEYGLSNQGSYLVFITKLDYHNLQLYNSSGVLNGNFTTSDERIDFKDALEHFKCALPIGEAYELYDETVRHKLVYRVLQYNGNYYLLSGLKVVDLNDMEFPVVVDPTLTVYSSSSDGHVMMDGPQYAPVHDAADGRHMDTDPTITVGQRYDPFGGPGTAYTIWRGFVFFDTSSIPSNDLIDSATLSLYKEIDSSVTDFDIVVQNGQPTYPHDPLWPYDYNKSYYSGNGGSLNTANFSTGYNNISLTNYSWINASGTTKLCLRSSRDIDNTTPTGDEYVTVRSSDYLSEGGYSPRLVIEYRNQSKIKNTGSTDIKGYLLMQVEYYNVSVEWVADYVAVDDTTPRIINSSEELALDLIFNGLVDTDNLTHGDGTYRVYAAFRDPEGNILQTNDEKDMVSWYEFEVSK